MFDRRMILLSLVALLFAGAVSVLVIEQASIERFGQRAKRVVAGQVWADIESDLGAADSRAAAPDGGLQRQVTSRSYRRVPSLMRRLNELPYSHKVLRPGWLVGYALDVTEVDGTVEHARFVRDDPNALVYKIW